MEKGRPNQAAVAHLPDDLIVEILARLPAGPLCRCKCVSRSWRALISDPAHRARLAQTLSGFFVLSNPDYSDSDSAPSSWSFIATQHQSPPLVDTALSFLPPSHGEIEILDSCNGLLLLRCSGGEGDSHRPFYVVCNPATGQWVALPQPSQAPGQQCDRYGRGIKTTSAALGFDPAVSSCFYVFQLQEENCVYDDAAIRVVEIYSSETGAWVWRLSGWKDRLVFCAGDRTYFKGFLYLKSFYEDVIAAVDTKGQTWRITRVKDRAYMSFDFVGHSQGRLLYVLENVEQLDDYLSICVLEDHANEESTVKHNFKTDLFRPTKSRQIVAFHPDGNLIFFYDIPSDRFMCYDMNRRDVHVICNVGGVKKPFKHLFLPYVPYYSRVLVVSPN